jgi:putative DNA primase/helicase
MTGIEDFDRLIDFSAASKKRRPQHDGDDIVTEDSVALQFAAQYGDTLRWCNHTGKWFEWDGIIWRKNERGLAFHWARELVRDMARTASSKTQFVTSKVSFAAGVERFCRCDPVFSVTSEVWDANPWLLGTPTGTVNLKTGELLPALQSTMITKSTAVAPAGMANCPAWLRFLDEATKGDAELIRFLRQWAGYSLTGITSEHALVFVYGPGGNGKSVFVNVLAGILADYGKTAPMETFTASIGDRHPTDIAMLRGARVVTASETEEGRQWAETRIKQMTGGDRLAARFMKKDFFEFVPQFKLTIIGNHKPVLRNVDDAAKRRFNIVPFVHKPPFPDKELDNKLKAEWPGILRWMIDGCLDWQKNGLVKPKSVTDATANYFENQDLFGHWLADACDCEPGNTFKQETTADLFASWKTFATNAGCAFGSNNSFADNMEQRGFSRWRNKHGRGFTGLKLKAGQKAWTSHDS